MLLVLIIISREFLMPCEPMPLSRKPWKGKWSGPRAGAALICKHARTRPPQSFANMSGKASQRQEVQTQSLGASDCQECPRVGSALSRDPGTQP